MRKPQECDGLFIDRILFFFSFFFLWHIQGCAVTHKDDCFFGGEEKNARLILEIMQILDAFGKKVGGEKNGDAVPQLEAKASWARAERLH